MRNRLPLIGLFFTTLIAALALALTIRGLPGNPTETELNTPYWKENGPFELSPERGRFALTYSLLENSSHSFSPALADFVDPDVGIHEGRLVSLFPPGVSYIIMPGYLLGRMIGHSQMGAAAMVALFALSNVITLILLARRLGAHPAAAILAGFTFLFASPAFTYGATLYQHHITTSLLLISIWLLTFNNNWWLLLISYLAGIAIVIDSPNAIFFVPIVLFGFFRLFKVKNADQNYTITLRPLQLLTFFSGLLPLLLLAYFNQQSYGNPWQVAGTITRPTDLELNSSSPSPAPAAAGNVALEAQTNSESPTNDPAPTTEKTSVAFFKTRNITNGIYTHFLAFDRGMLIFTPVLLLSVFGFGSLLQRHPAEAALLLGIIGTITLLYSMWGDPYGGWAFGSRYLIPVYALLSLFLAEALTRFRKNIFIVFLFTVLCTYSVAINTIGVLTTSANPPSVEVRALQEQGAQVYPGALNNLQALQQNRSKSYAFQAFFRPYLNAKSYASVLIAILLVPIYLHLLWLVLSKAAKTPLPMSTAPKAGLR